MNWPLLQDILYIESEEDPPTIIKLLPWVRLECRASGLGNAGPEILKSNNKNQLKIFKNEVKFY